jgi:anti-anti-sigma factor
MDMAKNPGVLELTIAQHDGAAEVTVRGEVDIHTCGELEKALTDLSDQGLRTITVDLQHVGFIDSSGLRVLVVGHKALQDNGGSLIVANPSVTTARLLEVTGLDGFFGADD